MRSHRVNNYALDGCAPMYITIGDSGNIEVSLPWQPQPCR
jgi:hypothetical protein